VRQKLFTDLEEHFIENRLVGYTCMEVLEKKAWHIVVLGIICPYHFV